MPREYDGPVMPSVECEGFDRGVYMLALTVACVIASLFWFGAGIALGAWLL
jgi:hypothetical protein